jgi:multiple antibiotic resistance protein
MEILLGTFSALFSVVNPFGAMPVFLTLTQDDSPGRRNRIALRACFYMALVLLAFFLAGQYILNFFGLRIHDLRIAGGMMLLKSGFDLLDSGSGTAGKKVSKEVLEESQTKPDISFTPLAMPLLSGPGSIAISIGLFTEKLRYFDFAFIILAILAVAIASFFTLYFAGRLSRFMGKAGLAALSRIMAFITLSLGVSFILTGLKAVFR